MRDLQVLQTSLAFQREQFYAEIGARIRRVREGKHLTQEGVATAVGLSRTSLTNIEKGRQKLLLHTLVEIAGALSVNPIELLPGSMSEFDGIQITLPSNLPEKHKDFVQRALSVVTHNENTRYQSNPKTSKRPASANPNLNKSDKC